jgi:hypothetical protein
MSKYEAAERLRVMFRKWNNGAEMIGLLDAALAAAKAEGIPKAVERIRARLVTEFAEHSLIASAVILAILDEEAAR